jgi:hypothetical protein
MKTNRPQTRLLNKRLRVSAKRSAEVVEGEMSWGVIDAYFWSLDVEQAFACIFGGIELETIYAATSFSKLDYLYLLTWCNTF